MPVVVHTMGKVGSVSITDMLAKANINAAHLHYGMYSEGEYSTAKQLKFGAGVYKNDDNWRIITLVRKPIWRNLSAYFHNLKKYYALDYYKFGPIKNNFLYSYNHATPADWFERDFNQLYKINYLDLPFDQDQKYAIYNPRTGLEILLIRMEDLNNVAGQAFKEFLNLQNVKVPHLNKTAVRTSWYAETKKTLTLPKDFIEYVNGFDWVRHYYSDQELAEDLKYLEPEVEPEWDPRPL